ncbi:MAG: hypothetical protein D6815_09410 [Candidatus Dadabacteria bacterium]|nr:MAG: hypothetical protein D6815_09410 [Candidatus Dadabacteria bacterium]
MPRTARIAPGGLVYHVLNRANGRGPIFAEEADYFGFLLVLRRSVEQYEMRLLAYCVMPNHWHLVVWPHQDGQLARFMHGLTTRHVRRWHRSHGTDGAGHLYQGPYRSFPVQHERHLLALCRYVERNPVAAGLVERAEQWPWSSAHQRSLETHRPGQSGEPEDFRPRLAAWPIDRPVEWPVLVNQPLTAADLERVRRSTSTGLPLGEAAWCAAVAERLALTSLLGRRGRPATSTA